MGSLRAFDPPPSSRVPRLVPRDVVEGDAWDDVEVRPSNPPIRRVELRLDPLLPLMVHDFIKRESMGSPRTFDPPPSSHVPRLVVRNVVEGVVWDDVEVRPSRPPIRRVELRLDPLLLLMVYDFIKGEPVGSPRAFDPPPASPVPRSVVRDVVEEEIWDDVEVRPSRPPIRRVELRLDPLLPLMVYDFIKGESMGSPRAFDPPSSSHVPLTVVRDVVQGEAWDDVEVRPSRNVKACFLWGSRLSVKG